MQRFTEIQQINSSIMFGSFTNDELNSIVSAVTFARAQLLKQAKNSFVRGSKVKFTSSRSGQVVIGEVTDVKRKFIHVRSGMTNWRVPANMLTAA
jgi:exosome complex RNA-binding protein Csl4